MTEHDTGEARGSDGMRRDDEGPGTEIRGGAETDERISIVGEARLSDGWGKLTQYTLAYRRRDGTRQTLSREVYDHGDGAAILLYDRSRNTVLLTRQFRLPVYLGGDGSGFVEVCAGMLDARAPEAAIRKEVEEETGVSVGEISEIGRYYMSPGSLSERLHCFVGAYSRAMRTGPGGGLVEEGEEIEALEIGFPEAMAMIRDGRIMDAKTVLLLQYAALEGLCSVRPAAGP
ncbi:NUDIX domain-containing protein [Swaminathania salitolerans]|uniref:GDP-mannose pyrophosphatase n=1 Tax=Swaminathania salitolerans TaxID=182838 RepID=A0A511BTD1_9PROT|nr:NUDIX domain-containing protein [Swaminathania salitolerans]GBQ13191.1 NUDIX hydrolase [Swaminathania salitolerans LMG 21291]GEL03362.1 hypothetical protein SSA02_25250 [Swaminathania salitolerans]